MKRPKTPPPAVQMFAVLAWLDWATVPVQSEDDALIRFGQDGLGVDWYLFEAMTPKAAALHAVWFRAGTHPRQAQVSNRFAQLAVIQTGPVS